MRIIAGSFKGRKLQTPKGRRTRPTSDRVRESVFSIVGDAVAGARILDLFSGTGAMGLEALSRGAREAVFLETDPSALRLLNANIDLCGCRERSRVAAISVLQYLEKEFAGESFDLVFADPPYASDLGNLTLLAVSKNAKPFENCLLIVEHSPGRIPGPVPENMLLSDSRKYGNTGISIFRFKDPREA